MPTSDKQSIPVDLSPRDLPLDDDDWVPAQPEPPLTERQEHQPGTPAPGTGYYEELNGFGTPTGRLAYVREGERLPLSPRGATWWQIEEEGP